MDGESNLSLLIQNLSPTLNDGQYIFATVSSLESIGRDDTIFEFKESEGITVIVEKEKADLLELSYNFIASWITLKVHSSLSAVGLTAAVSNALAENNISCNVVAAYYHDHIFIESALAIKAMQVLSDLSTKKTS